MDKGYKCSNCRWFRATESDESVYGKCFYNPPTVTGSMSNHPTVCEHDFCHNYFLILSLKKEKENAEELD